ncbi:MAG: hypothetical protein IKI75_09995 [Lachnospiraceae bacterium]|nr:hypothetical protein [Lachnospiraceae bacterium]
MKRTLPVIIILFSLLLTACGAVTCDFCGRTRFCKTFDVMGVERNICSDCLDDPRIAVSGNVVRVYSEIYENGDGYPEWSPLYEATPGEEITLTPTPISNILELIPEAPVGQSYTPVTDPVDEPVPSPEQPREEASSNVDPSASSAGLKGTELYDALAEACEEGGLSLSPSDSDSSVYVVSAGGSDTGVRVKIIPGSGSSDGLSVEHYDPDHSSDFAKCAIRSVITLLGSDDYDGLGHEVYNQAVQLGHYDYGPFRFSFNTHDASEIEKGSPSADFTISPL